MDQIPEGALKMKITFHMQVNILYSRNLLSTHKNPTQQNPTEHNLTPKADTLPWSAAEGQMVEARAPHSSNVVSLSQ